MRYVIALSLFAAAAPTRCVHERVRANAAAPTVALRAADAPAPRSLVGATLAPLRISLLYPYALSGTLSGARRAGRGAHAGLVRRR